MELNLVIGLTAVFLAVVSAGAVGSYFLFPRNQVNLRALMGSGAARGLGTPAEERLRLREDPTGKEFERLKTETKKKFRRSAKPPLDERLFHAGIFSERDKQEFQRLRLLAPAFCVPVLAALGFSIQPTFGLLGAVFGLAIGFQLPFSILDRRVAARNEDIMFYLPLVIEQIVIGVSSSLDVGPCLQRVVTMADERDSHNSVTELLRHAHHYVRSGISLEDALIEVGKRSGHTELKHAFMSLSQVARHGGEVTKQLQELADAVAMQRETRVEAKIKKLELEATMPVALVFMGFLLIILIGFGLQVLKAFE